MSEEANYDVIIVGSGAGGGMAAHRLTQAGIKVLVLEAGRDYDPYSETAMFGRKADAPLRGASTSDKQMGYYSASVDGGWEIPGEPYATANGSDFQWWRSRMLGGRTNQWARNSFRMGSYDFKPASRDGLGVDWPIEYEDLAPFYDRTEELIGVYGANSGIDGHPDSGPGILHDPPKPRIYELLVKAGCDDLGIPCVPARRAILTRPIDDRMACFYATACNRGCSIGAAFQSTTSLLPMAEATGHYTKITDAMVREILVDDEGRASGVRYVDKKERTEKSLSARVVVLAASACESARLLLNSKSDAFPEGLANSSGQIGRNLMDTVGAAIDAELPALNGRPAYNEDGAMGMHMYIPWWLYQEQANGELDFPRGYHVEVYGGRREPGAFQPAKADGYGAQFKADIRERYGNSVRFACRGEMIPNSQTYCEIHPHMKDRYGIPVLQFHWQWSEHELKLVDHFQTTMQSLVSRLGGTVQTKIRPPEEAIWTGGSVIHEVGTTRMGSSPETSVTNQYGQCWDVDNLFIVDGGVFASKAHKNPTLTILALAWRSSDYLANQMRAGAI